MSFVFSHSGADSIDRFVLAATDHLRRKMTNMEARMHSLEDALAIVQANNSNRPHPLLSAPDEDDDDDDEEPILKPFVEDCLSTSLSDALGTLHMGDHGSSRFFGPSGGSEVCILFIFLDFPLKACFFQSLLLVSTRRFIINILTNILLESQRYGSTIAMESQPAPTGRARSLLPPFRNQPLLPMLPFSAGDPFYSCPADDRIIFTSHRTCNSSLRHIFGTLIVDVPYRFSSTVG